MKKYVIALLLGMLTGVVLLVLLLYFNPLNNPQTLSPLSVSRNEVLVLNYSAVASGRPLSAGPMRWRPCSGTVATSR